MNDPASRKKAAARSGMFAWFIVVAGLLSALGLALYGILAGGRDTHSEWLKLSDELKKQGEPLYLADMKPADVPPEQNFFEAEVFSGLAAGAPADALLRQAADPGNGLSVAELLASATQGGGASLENIAAAMEKAGLLRAKTEFLLAGDRVRFGMRRLGLDFTPLAAAADRPAARFPIDYARLQPALPHLRYLEALGDWLAIRAIAEISTGDAESAATDLLLIGRLADSIAAEPFPASQKTRRLLMGLFAGCVRVGIDWGAWTDEQLAQFGKILPRANLLTDFAWAVRGERATLNSAVNAALSGQRPAATSELSAWLGDDLAKLDLRALRRRQTEANRAIQLFLDGLAATPLSPAALEPPAAFSDTIQKRLRALAGEARVAAQLQTYLAQAEIACALERYRLARGSYPDAPEKLVPDDLAALPPDPLTGKPPAYRREPPGGFTLTGAGWTPDQPWAWVRKP